MKILNQDGAYMYSSASLQQKCIPEPELHEVMVDDKQTGRNKAVEVGGEEHDT